MRIIGVDPGTLVTGFGVIDVVGSNKFQLVEYGVVTTKPKMTMPMRLAIIYNELVSVMDRTLPDEFAIESAFYAKNVQSTLKLGHARGVAILTAVLRQIPTGEYAPREVKRAVTGNGNSSKENVEYMVMTLLQLTERHKFLDATDALSVAICHAMRLHQPKELTNGAAKTKRKSPWASFLTDNPEREIKSGIRDQGSGISKK